MYSWNNQYLKILGSAVQSNISCAACETVCPLTSSFMIKNVKNFPATVHSLNSIQAYLDRTQTIYFNIFMFELNPVTG